MSAPDPTKANILPTIESDDYAVYHGEDSVVIISARETGFKLHGDLAYTESTLLIYAETVLLDGEVHAPGLNIGLFCNALIIAPTAEPACIDVSGSSGRDGRADHTDGDDGGGGGSVWLYVEEPMANLSDRLRIKAFGGDGGIGLRAVTKGENGGKGGNGGACGTISCYVGSPLMAIGRDIIKYSRGKHWSETVQSTINSASFEGDIKIMEEYGLDKDVVRTWQTTMEKDMALIVALQALQHACQQLVDPDSEDPNHVIPSKATTDQVSKLQTMLGMVASSVNGPASVQEDDTAAFRNLAQACCDFTGGASDETKLRESVANATERGTLLFATSTAQAVSGLSQSRDDILMGLRVAMKTFTSQLVHTTCALASGVGGRGGLGEPPDGRTGARGQTQLSESAKAFVLSFDEQDQKVEPEQALAFPEQCEMLLQKADALYLAATAGTRLDMAGSYYTRLVRRLHYFDSQFATAATPDDPRVEPYNKLVTKYQLTFEPVAQLQRIYKTAQARLNTIAMGQDLFSHATNWVPRCSMTYYEQRVKDMISDLQRIEDSFSAFSKTDDKAQTLRTELENTTKTNGANKIAADNRISQISKIGGPMDVASTTIAQASPRLAAESLDLIASIKELEQYIQSSFQMPLSSVIGALTTLSMSPNEFTGITQGFDLAYKAGTTMIDQQGTSYRKDYIIDELETCTGSLRDLTETYQRMADGSLTVDAPGFGKVMATVETLEKVLKDFSNVIPAAKRDVVQSAVDAYLTTVKQRNNAVVAYNVQIQQLLHLITLSNSCANESKTLGEQALSLSPEMPAIFFWLKNLKQNAELEVMQLLCYEARALAFIVPMDPRKTTFDPPGPVDGSLALSDHQTKLNKLFDSCFEEGALWMYWPGSEQLVDAGIIFELPRVLEDLKVLSKDGKGNGMYEAGFTLTPDSAPEFRDMANIRLTQVRIWLLGATVEPDVQGRAILTIEIQHSGTERIWDVEGQSFLFEHAPVELQFSYNTNIFNRDKTISGDPALVTRRQALEVDWNGQLRPGPDAIPPLGPFTDWRIQILDINGVDLSKVEKLEIELCGRNLASKSLQAREL